MPIMNVQHVESELDAGKKAALADKLTRLLLQMEGGANTDGGRGFASVLFTPLAPGNWWVGGQTDDRFVSAPGRFLVHVSIPEGYMNKAHKAEVQTGVTTAILEVIGGAGSHQPGSTIQVIIDEVTEGNWAAGGKTISIVSIADTVGLAKSGERFAWVKAYFAAKARQFASAGYPSDVGGLITQG